jgi:hypothetical protein
LHQASVAAGLHACVEPRDLMASERTRPDLEIRDGPASTFVDVVVSHTTAPSHVDKAQRQLGAATAATLRKRHKYTAFASGLNAQFRAFSIETFGGFDVEARRVVDEICKAQVPAHATMTEGELRRLMMYGIPCVLQTGNAQAMAAWLGRAQVANTIAISRRNSSRSAGVDSDSVAESVDRGISSASSSNNISARGDLDVAELESDSSNSLGDVGLGGRPHMRIEIANAVAISSSSRNTGVERDADSVAEFVDSSASNVPARGDPVAELELDSNHSLGDVGLGGRPNLRFEVHR